MTQLHDKKQEVVDVVLSEVPFLGWNWQTVKESVTKCNLDQEYADILFPEGIDEIITIYIDRIDLEMKQVVETEEFQQLSIRNKIASLVKARFQVMEQSKVLSVATIKYLMMPHNVVLSNKLLFRTVDMMWRLIGDKSTDYNYYSKRMLLSAVYSSSLLYWMSDDSEGNERTNAFIDRRIADVMKIGKLKSKYCSTDVLENIPFARLFRDKFSNPLIKV